MTRALNRNALLAALAISAADCESKSDLGAGGPAATASGVGRSAQPPSAAPAALAATSAAAIASAPAVPVKVSTPIAVTRKHEVGQRYAVEMTHTGTLTNRYTATLTVTDAAPTKVQLALLVKSLTSNDKERLSNAAFEVTLVPPIATDTDRVDAKQLAGPDGQLYLTSLESMVGDVCWAPKQAHKPGDKWKEKEGSGETSWELVSVESEGGLTYVQFKGDWATKGSTRHYELRLATSDGYTGTCRVDTTLDLGGSADKQRYDIRVRPL
jgi:hypothetical protein